MNIVPFNADSALPAYLQAIEKLPDVNKDIVTAAAFPSMSIRGKQFTLNRDGVKKVLTKPDDPDEVAQSIGVVILRANMNAKVFYMKKYAEGDSDGAQPDCYSYDGVGPSANSRNPQAKKCAVCKNNEWGSRISPDAKDGEEKKGKACSDNARLAISTPDGKDPMLLRVPPASLKSLREAVKVINTRKIPYNAVIVKIGFDREASSPKLTFKPVGLVDEATYRMIETEQYDSDIVRAITGVDDQGHEGEVAPAPATGGDLDEFDQAIAARAQEPAPAPAAAPARAAKAAPAAPAAEAFNMDDLDGLDATPAAAPAPAPAPAPRKPRAAAAPAAPVNTVAPAAPSGVNSMDDLDALLAGTDD